MRLTSRRVLCLDPVLYPSGNALSRASKSTHAKERRVTGSSDFQAKVVRLAEEIRISCHNPT